MVKPKQQKSKLKKPTHKVIKTKGKQADISQFRAQLDTLGLKIIQVTADGNCFFRALADQLEGNEEEHEKYRSMVVQYIVKNRETFEPFIEDDVPFDEYCLSMEEDGTWAGHMELQAASLVTRCNICIHRHMSPRWYIRNFDSDEARMVHLSYHDGEHYNSVRLKEDPCNGSARPIIIKVDADLSAASHQAKTAASKSKVGSGPNVINAGSIKMVMAGTGCENAERVEQVLLEVGGDTDAAIEFLVAEQGAEDYTVENNSSPCHMDISHGDNENGNGEQLKVEPVNKTCEQDLSSNSLKRAHDDVRFQPDDKKIPRNKVCPCGSKKKFKACCGSAAGRSTKFVVNMMSLRYYLLDIGENERQHEELLTAVLSISLTKQLILERVERKGSKARAEDLQNPHPPLDLMEGHLTWVRYVYDLILNVSCVLLIGWLDPPLFVMYNSWR